MSKKLILKIAGDIKQQGKKVLFVENTDDFLSREDVQNSMAELGILIIKGPQLIQRLYFELRDTRYVGKTLVFLMEDDFDYLQDMWRYSILMEIRLDQYLYGYHQESIIQLDLSTLDKLFLKKRVKQQLREETLREIQLLSSIDKSSYSPDLDKIKEDVQKSLSGNPKNWHSIIKTLSSHLRESIGTPFQNEIFNIINEVNMQFQDELALNYKSLISSSPIKKPSIVSKILDHLVQIPRNNKVALLVIDGLSYWQYQMIKEDFPENFKVNEELTYSWVPSVTELSRQAIFKGSVPDYDYIQNPQNEKKLWNKYWNNKGFFDNEIGYQHTTVKSGNRNILRLAVVLKELDDKMHGSEDYDDLRGLTKNWIKRSKLIFILEELLKNNYSVYLTTDHGSIQAKGWRNIRGKEKLGTHNSKSQRHLNYSEDWIANDFLEKNPELKENISRDENTIYFKNDYSFSNKESLITHGGSHILEVLIPFVKITL